MPSRSCSRPGSTRRPDSWKLEAGSWKLEGSMNTDARDQDFSSSFQLKLAKRAFFQLRAKPGFSSGAAASRALRARDRHLVDQPATGMYAAPGVDIVTDSHQPLEHRLEIAGNGELFDRMLDPAILHPEAGGAT
ncbi:hypothetical protein SAMN05192556_10716 [Halomonas caseinilytica]|uniref:Uncharacterized protein n=1 Tax=Halomonas caseinilytica TaxID=438744 RepID=A0A1M6X2C1_9GAMM|nr:hypothetical protein SAMN05192556_10716 [Halomonas caseinilytica]